MFSKNCIRELGDIIVYRGTEVSKQSASSCVASSVVYANCNFDSCMHVCVFKKGNAMIMLFCTEAIQCLLRSFLRI